jgi:hypothetical protein
MMASQLRRGTIVATLAIFGLAFGASGDDRRANIQIMMEGDHSWLLKISQSVPGPKGWKENVQMVVPRGQPVVPVGKILRYKSSIEYNNGDSSYLTSPPPFGFVLFGSDSQGTTVEIRLVELFDKHDFVASSLNGIYHVTFPTK